jgi:hypothetical protein
MKKQLILTILLVRFLCALGFAQRGETFGEVQFVHLKSSHNADGWNVALTGNFEGASKIADVPGTLQGWAKSCTGARSMLLDFVNRDGDLFGEVRVWRSRDSQAFFFVSGMAIDADGAPNAYNSYDTGLDELANAGAPAHWNGIIIDRDGNPLIQQEDDPFPGYYISCTSLSDETKRFADPTAYVNASKIPYVALPQDVADRATDGSMQP